MSWTDGTNIKISGYGISQDEWDIIFPPKPKPPPEPTPPNPSPNPSPSQDNPSPTQG